MSAPDPGYTPLRVRRALSAVEYPRDTWTLHLTCGHKVKVVNPYCRPLMAACLACARTP